MRGFATLVCLLVLPLAGMAVAQENRGYLQAFLEDNLSDAGREVRITGFEGALSARATIEELTIADATGIWLTLRGAVLDWNRASLLRGRLEISELSAREILLPRLPVSVPADAALPVGSLPDLPSAEAPGFALPELPVAIDIGSMSIAKVVLGKALFGEAATIAFNGSAALDSGAGQAELALRRIDMRKGEMAFAASYANQSRNLALSFRLSEAANGIAATLIGLPGRPPVDLQITGDAPLEDFTADVSLKTGGSENLAGQITLASPPGAEPGTQAFAANLGGDLRPLVLPQYRGFLGPDVRLAAQGQRTADGRLLLERFSLAAKEARFSGSMALGADYWPQRFALDGRIESDDGGDVLLAIPGPQTHVGNAVLTMRYDAARSRNWAGSLNINKMRRSDFSVENLRVTGGGTLVQGEGPAVGAFSGKIDLSAGGIRMRDPALARAVGPSLAGLVWFDLQEDQPLTFPEFTLSGADYSLSGGLAIQGLQDRLNLTAAGRVRLAAQDLARFSGLAGQPLAGSADLQIVGASNILGGAFDLRLSGATRDLGVGVPRLDGLIAGEGRIDLSLRRDEAGTTIEQLQLTSTGAEITVGGSLKTGASNLQFDLRLPNAALLAPGLDGQAAFTGSAVQSGTEWALLADLAAPGGARANLDARMTIAGNRIGPISGRATAEIDDLAPYSALAGRALDGSAQVAAEGQADLRLSAFAGSLTGTARELQLGIAEADRLLRGESRLALDLRLDAGGITVFDRLDLTTPQIVADLTGSVSAEKSRLRFDLDLRDLGLYATGQTGRVTAEGVVSSVGAGWNVGARLMGPGGTAANVDGTITADAARADLTISGTAPLALANPYIAPNLASGPISFDLALNGPIALTSLAGTLRAGSASLVLPGQRIALGNITADAQLAGGQLQLEASSGVTSGGQVGVSGPVALSSPYASELAIELVDVAVSEPGLYETTVAGRLAMRGALADGATIDGALVLGPLEIRVPDTGGVASGQLPGLEHRNAPAAVRQTLARAGVQGGSTPTGGGAANPLNITVDAPSRIFVRGRGLDAELGGRLRRGGTTANVITDGRFELIRGRLDILGKRLTLTEGFAQLQGDFDPHIRVVAETEAGGARIRIVIEGLASSPQIVFTSSPELPEDEIVSRLLVGRDLSQISPLQALRIASAINTLSGRGRGDIVNRLRQNFGLDDLDVTTDEAGATGVRVGKYISENIYSDVTVDSTGRSRINLNLSITPSLTARGKLGSDSNLGIGLFLEKDY